MQIEVLENLEHLEILAFLENLELPEIPAVNLLFMSIAICYCLFSLAKITTPSPAAGSWG